MGETGDTGGMSTAGTVDSTDLDAVRGTAADDADERHGSCRSHRMWWLVLVCGLLVAGCGQLVMNAGNDLHDTVYDSLPSVEQCEDEHDGTCLDANRARERYGLDQLARNGLTGKDVTVAVIDVSGAGTFSDDLEEYSSRMGLPPPRLRVRDVELGYEPFREYDASDRRAADAALDTTRQLQLVHTFAPQANILLDRLRFPENENVNRSVDELLAIRLRSLVNEGEADVVLLGHGVAEHVLSERTEPVSDLLRNRRTVFDDAARAGVTVIAPGGSRPAWPAVDPGVLAVGGQAGESQVFDRPNYQVNHRSVDGGGDEGRTVPDLRVPAPEEERHLLYQSVSDQPGWIPVRATEAERAAGLVALAAQQAGGEMGKINDDVYYLATEAGAPASNGLRVAGVAPGSAGRREVTDAGAFVRGLADSAEGSPRAVPDERPEPEQECHTGNPIDLRIQDRQNIRFRARLCTIYDPIRDTLTGELTVAWLPQPDSDAGPVGGRFSDFEARTVLERAGSAKQNESCSLTWEMNHWKRGSETCRVTISEPGNGSWTTDGRLEWNRNDQQGDSPQQRNLRGTSVLDLG